MATGGYYALGSYRFGEIEKLCLTLPEPHPEKVENCTIN